MESIEQNLATTVINQLKGLPACITEEIVKGIAYVLLDFSKVHEFPHGSILITEQTSPECTNAMESALAVVTQRGGILCHAAIVCRDINTPCIVGVKDLLKYVNTGMAVEINTKTGTIQF
jgi:pyruvate,water dikinase